MRLFVAVDLSDDARQAIVAEQKQLSAALARSRDSLKLVRLEQMHVTLLFLGEVQEARVPALIDAMNAAVALPAFDIAFGGAGVFPPRGAPRVLWMGVTRGAESLARLQAEVAARIRGLGIACDDRPFHAHLTLGRWREPRRGAGVSRPPLVEDGGARRRGTRKSLRREGGALRESGTVATVHVTHATLYQSRLSSSGAAYSALAHATLAQTGMRDP